MAHKLTVRRIVSILKRVPEKRFSIMDLAPQLIDEKGKVDIIKAVDRQGDLNLAIIEVESYVKATKDAARALANVAGTRYEVEEDDDDDFDDGEDDEE